MPFSRSGGFLYTASSEIIKKTFFNNRYTILLPDFFFITVFMSLFIISGLMDRVFMILVLFHTGGLIFGILLSASSLAPLFYTFFYRNFNKDFLPETYLSRMSQWLLQVVIILFGLDVIVMGGRALLNAIKYERRESMDKNKMCASDTFFHISDENMFFIKVYCYFYLGIKVIPQLLIVPIIILKINETNGSIVGVGTSCIFLNMLIFSLTMAITLPIRRTPKIFTSSMFIILNSLSKFMGTFCACGLNLSMFTMIFKTIGYYSLFFYFLKFLLSSWPCWLLVRPQNLTCRKIELFLYGLFLTSIFNYIYIHPFEGKGKLYYFYYYLCSSLTEIACIYIYSDVKPESIATYFGLRVLTIGFLSCFGLINIFFKAACVTVIPNDKSVVPEPDATEKRDNDSINDP